MSQWNSDDLVRIANADDLHIAPLRDDGVTCGTPTWIWSVVVDGGLYVRAYNGTASRWHRSAVDQKAGQITIAGRTLNVAFAPVDGPIGLQIDDAYRTKYTRSPYLTHMIGPTARAATIKIIPVS
ncbi:DUF2255 family protein [Mesorhizobium sp. Cs1321R2N1]|uniref:DUF2255 family protein n=1 Tax=Mesorhizobium sp. Cs1321R2N1 TaxID=3015174 RepID=UPI00301BACB5